MERPASKLLSLLWFPCRDQVAADYTASIEIDLAASCICVSGTIIEHDLASIGEEWSRDLPAIDHFRVLVAVLDERSSIMDVLYKDELQLTSNYR